ncbi:MAG: hypothetical protein ABI882_13425, partial [Acidobacteriota bacterium]
MRLVRAFATALLVGVAAASLVAAVKTQRRGAATVRATETAPRLPRLYWVQGIETAPALKQAGIQQIAVPPDKLDGWRKAGFNVLALNQSDL